MRGPKEDLSRHGLFCSERWNGLWEPIGEIGESCQLSCHGRLHGSGGKPPSPVAAVKAWCVHARFAAEAQHILQRDYAQARYRTLSSSNQGPVNAIFGTSEIGLGGTTFLFGGATLPPALCRVVVVRSGIDNDIGSELLWKIH